MDMKFDGVSRCNLLDDTEFVRRFVVGLARHIGMTIVNGPTVHSFKETRRGSDSGLSAYAIIAESHIAVHTWPEIDYVRTDISSCRDFDGAKAVEFVVDYLKISETAYQNLDTARPSVPMSYGKCYWDRSEIPLPSLVVGCDCGEKGKP